MLTDIAALPVALFACILFRGKNVARPRFLLFSRAIASAATWSFSTTTEFIPPPTAVARASACEASFGAHNSEIVPIIPFSSPLSLAAITAAAPGAIPLLPERLSSSVRAAASFLSAFCRWLFTVVDSSMSFFSADCALRNSSPSAVLSFSGLVSPSSSICNCKSSYASLASSTASSAADNCSATISA